MIHAQLGSAPLLLILIFATPWFITSGCSQDSTHSSANGVSPVSEVSTRTAVQDIKKDGSDQIQSSVPELSESARQASLSDISFMQADTDGDGIPDAIGICEETKVCITRGRTHELTVYSHPSWKGVRMVNVQDTDGKAGEEVILLVTNDEGAVVCVCVIHDNLNAIAIYHDIDWHSATVQFIVDTDGEPGQEIVLLAVNKRGEVQCLCIIHDRNESYKTYREWDWHSVASVWHEDTNGIPGHELVVEVHDSEDRLQCVCVIHDDIQKMNVYTDSSWLEGHITLLIDTDGQAGTDIVVAYQTSLGSGIDVVHDRSLTTRQYAFRSEIPSIQHISQGSRAKGQDICVLLQQENQLLLLTEREDKPISVSTCDPNT